MNIKVGDIVEYKGETVRLMAVYPSHNRLRLANFGIVIGELSNLKLIRSVPPHDIHPDDYIIVRDIPKDEKIKYPFKWGQKREGCVSSDETYKVMSHYCDENYGNIAYVNGLWFQTYHLEKINDFDIV